jgi:leader peptidase (prepilin peptidase)/N-methyltransferase
LNLFLDCVIFVLGLVFGSFLNVCISRIPRDLSIVLPRSFCPNCRAAISWRDNIPLVSWIVLRGRCRHCSLPISLRYPAVELLTAVLFVICYASFGWTWLALKACVLCFLVVGLIFMDAETGLLPHEFTYPGIGFGIASAWFGSFDSSGTHFLLDTFGPRGALSGPQLALLDSLAGAVFGAGFFYLAWALYYVVRRRSGMGFGDIALIAMVGAFLGLKLTVLVVFLSPILATIFGIALILTRRDADNGSGTEVSATGKFLSREVRFGVFLGISSLIALLAGKQIWGWYFGLFR